VIPRSVHHGPTEIIVVIATSDIIARPDHPCAIRLMLE
jgi:hypothetical protein